MKKNIIDLVNKSLENDFSPFINIFSKSLTEKGCDDGDKAFAFLQMAKSLIYLIVDKMQEEHREKGLYSLLNTISKTYTSNINKIIH